MSDQHSHEEHPGILGLDEVLVEAVLREANQELIASLRQEFASPFIAHHSLTDTVRVRRAIKTLIGGDFRRVQRLFFLAPAVAVWVIADALAAHYGGDSGNNCYPPITAALGLDYELYQTEKVDLRGMFRRAASRLGLSLPPAGGGSVAGLSWQPMDDFFAQAGVAIGQTRQLADLLRKGQASFGTPEADSTESLAQWEVEVVERHTPEGLRRAPKVLLSDATGYHAGLFARLESGGTPDTPFAKRLQEELEGSAPAKAGFVPRLVLAGEQLQIRDSQRNAAFDVEIDGWPGRVRWVRTFSIPLPWPERVRCGLPDQAMREVSVLPKGTLAVLFDADSGRLERTIHEGSKIVPVRNGEVAILSRYPFTAAGTASIPVVDSGIDAHLLYVTVANDVQLEVSSQRCTLRPTARAAIRLLDGELVGRDAAKGIPLLAGVDRVVVEYPGASELVKSGGFELHLYHPALPEDGIRVACPQPDNADTMTTSLAGVLPAAGEFGLLQIELRQIGSERRLARERYWLWPGLAAFVGGMQFHAPSIPSNWDRQRSESIHEVGGFIQLDSPSEIPYEWARLVMCEPNDTTGDAEPLASFLLLPPGVSLVLQEQDGTRRPLKVGQPLALSQSEQSTLIIRTTHAAGRLDIRGNVERESFRKSVRQLRAVVLAHTVAVDGGHGDIRYHNGTPGGSWQTLLRLLEVTEPLTFVVHDEEEKCLVRVSFTRMPTNVRVHLDGIGMSTAHVFDQYHPALHVLRFFEGNTLDINLNKWRLETPGLYRARLEVMFEEGRWLELTNQRRDRYDWVVAHQCPAHTTTSEDLTALLPALTEILGRCAASECWEGSIHRHLIPRWKAAITGLSRQSPPNYEACLMAAHAPWDTERSSTWVPVLHPIADFPNLYGAPPVAYRRLRRMYGVPAGELLGEIAALHSAGTLGELLDVILLERRFVASYTNVAALSKGTEITPVGFTFDRYQGALNTISEDDRDSFWTPKRARLTQEHHAWCCEQFAGRLRRVRAPGRNPDRIYQLEQIARSVKDLRQLPGTLALAPRALGVSDSILLQVASDDRVLVRSMPALLSMLVQYSLRHRQADLEQRIADTLDDHRAPRWPAQLIRDAFGFATRLAPELLAFYLLLWHLAQFGETNDARTEPS